MLRFKNASAILVLAALASSVHSEPVPAPAPTVPLITVAPQNGKAPKAGEPISLSGPEFELLTLTGVDAATAITWDVTEPSGGTPPVKLFEVGKSPVIGIRAGSVDPDRYDPPTSPAVAVYAKGSGRAVVSAWGVQNGKPMKLATMLVNANTPPQPKPIPPGPLPNPNPSPNPPSPVVSQPLFVVIIEETADAVATRGSMFADPTLSAAMKAKGDKWRVADKDVVGPDGKQPADIARFLNDAKGKGYPQVYLVGQKGETVYGGPLPTKPADLLSLITQYGG